MRFSEYVKQRRLEKGLSDVEFAERIGLNVYWAGDLEQDETELDGITVPVFKKMCAVLDMQANAIVNAVISNLKDRPLSELVNLRREEKGFTIDELSDRIGHDRRVIDVIEGNGDLSEVCLNALKRIAAELDLPYELLLLKL